MLTIAPNPPGAPSLPTTFLSKNGPSFTIHSRSQQKAIIQPDHNFGIELAGEGPGVCTLCEKPGSGPFAGFFSLEDGGRVRLCEICLFEESATLGLLLAGAAFLRKVGQVSLPESRRKMAAEIATFARCFETILTRRFGPAEPSQLLEHFAQVGGLASSRYLPRV